MLNSNSVHIYYSNLNQISLEQLLAVPNFEALLHHQNTFSTERKKQYLLSRYLLLQLLNDHYDINQLPLIETTDNGRPAFIDLNLPHFNITHSQHYVAVAIASKGKIGCDIEVKRERKNYLKVAHYIFSEHELDWLTKQPSTLDAFWRLWTLRESALKLYAKGVWQMKNLMIEPIQPHITSTFDGCFYPKHQQFNDFHLAVCCEYPIAKINITSPIILL